MMRWIRRLALAGSTAFLAACGGGDDHPTALGVAQSNPQFSILVEAVNAAGLADTLAGPGPLTVFAPTNQAFAAVPAKTLDELAKDPAQLKAVLAYHVVPAKVMAADVKNGKAKTANGADLNHDVGFIGVPLFHIAGIGNLLVGLTLGVPTVIHPLGAFDPGGLLDVLEAENVTGIFLVPAQWQAVCAVQQARPRSLKLRVISWGAAPASDTLLRTMAETFPGSKILAAFGQTEMSPVTCMLLGDDALRKLGSVGRVIPTVSARVVDEDMNDVPVGEIGEIVYRAPTLMAGYWNNPTATAEAFAGGWFHSGDLVKMDDEGYVWVVDRKKDMIISGGENIYCAEVENALAAHPEIVEAAVIGRSDEKWGEIPVAVVAISSEQLRIEDLDAFLDERLARYKHPKVLEIVEALPRNPAGKVLKTELRKQYAEPAE